MKIISSESNRDGKRIVCEDAVFDPYLAKLINYDKDEMVILINYDANENGHPLGLPILPSNTMFIVKLTPAGIHTSLIISDFGDSITAQSIYEEYGDKLGSIEFNVRMTTDEKLQLMQHIAISLLSETK